MTLARAREYDRIARMAEPFKNLFNAGMIAEMARHFERVDPGFDAAAFISQAVEGLEALELKQRSRQITAALEAHLPQDFAAACDLMLAALHPDEETSLSDMSMDARGIRGWGVMPMADFVAACGMDAFDDAMDVLAEMTKRSSSEFAVRPFIAADPERAMGHLTRWAASKNTHVRRLASEGSRPRLPWGMRLQVYVDDPAPLLPLLAALRDDSEEYVRRSVANNLNDIAKDHDDLVAEIARDWLRDASKERARLVRHACRSLVKQGHAATLAALGFGPAAVTLAGLEIKTPVVEFGSALEFEIDLTSDSGSDQDLILDYAIHHRKARGGTSPKVFKWKVMKLGGGKTMRMARKHPMRPITTRVYYNGAHRLEIVANGVVLGGAGFALSGV
jgi:3-methyladenine DNA glycosylase AlkC